MGLIVSAIIQVRSGSKRFPKKSHAKLGNLNLIDWVVKRTKRSKHIDQIILATTDLKEDKIFQETAEKHKIKIFFGEKENVLKRFVDASNFFYTDIIVRICADNPLVSPEFLDELIIFFKENHCDLSFNHQSKLNYKVVDGFGAEIFKKDTLKKIFEKKINKSQLEHVTKFFWDNYKNIRILACPVKKIFQNSSIKFDIDYQNDLLKLNNFIEKHKFNFKTSAEELVRAYE